MKKLICFLLIPMMLLFTPTKNASAYSSTMTLRYFPGVPSNISTATISCNTTLTSDITVYVSQLTDGAYLLVSFSNHNIPSQIINSTGTYYFNFNQFSYTNRYSYITMTFSLHTNDSLPGCACISIA